MRRPFSFSHRFERRARLANLAIAAQLLAACHGWVASTISSAMRSPPPAGHVHEDVFFSDALGVRKHMLVYLPPSYDADTTRHYPVAYYLHGLSGSEADWVTKGNVTGVADSLFARGTPEMILVMPDGDDGWYTTWTRQFSFRTCADTVSVEAADKYCVEHERYDDYIAKDVVRFVDAHYRTRADRAHRGIAGLSMGGYGAMILAFHYPNVFGAAASHSGVVSPMFVGPRPVAQPIHYGATTDEIRPAAGGFFNRYLNFWGTDIARWRAIDPAHAAEELARRGGPMPALFFDCGTDDGFIDQNRALNLELNRLRIRHTYAESPGIHNWRFWSTHVPASLSWLGERIGP